jgi:hypothetical protein
MGARPSSLPTPPGSIGSLLIAILSDSFQVRSPSQCPIVIWAIVPEVCLTRCQARTSSTAVIEMNLCVYLFLRLLRMQSVGKLALSWRQKGFVFFRLLNTGLTAWGLARAFPAIPVWPGGQSIRGVIHVSVVSGPPLRL